MELHGDGPLMYLNLLEEIESEELLAIVGWSPKRTIAKSGSFQPSRKKLFKKRVSLDGSSTN